MACQEELINKQVQPGGYERSFFRLTDLRCQKGALIAISSWALDFRKCTSRRFRRFGSGRSIPRCVWFPPRTVGVHYSLVWLERLKRRNLPWDKRPSVGCFVNEVPLSLTVTLLQCRPLDWRRLSTLATSCEVPPLKLPFISSAVGLTPPFDAGIPSAAAKVRIDFHHSQSRLGTSDRVQYYTFAITTIFFYDFLLTLGDEVSYVVSVSFAVFIVPTVKGQIRLAGEEIMGCVGRTACRMASVDDLIVFAIFLAVSSPLHQSSFVLEG